MWPDAILITVMRALTYMHTHTHTHTHTAPKRGSAPPEAPAIALLSSSSDDDMGFSIAPRSMKVAALKKALKARDLSTLGRKADLCKRLQRALAERKKAKVSGGMGEWVGE